MLLSHARPKGIINLQIPIDPKVDSVPLEVQVGLRTCLWRSDLARALTCDINDLPRSLVLSCYKQKAVAILLTLFYLAIQDIRQGPSLPA